MFALPDLIALSLLPVWRWRAVAEQLRAGQTPHDILRCHCLDGRRRRTRAPAWTSPDWVMQRADAAVRRGQANGLIAVGIDGEAYPDPDRLDVHRPLVEELV